ncbi:hypothetical protein GCM10010869_42870 [Mesorhizobium tianshanense]|uniref:hypothetical protein n=1 Tax=Mesorhizobium tianshanense TaxID=39844 RepID=UPI0011A3FE39|nr:hypothetical protein [Mesorhizobium tianshanense]GLS38691.1 hypothetical protein GCM10010869_42870 [Mesorhizobium tianshanense]
MFRPHLTVTIRHAFKAPVRFDPDVIVTEGGTISVGLGCGIVLTETVGAFAAADHTLDPGGQC